MPQIYLNVIASGIISSYYIVSPEAGFTLSLLFLGFWFIGIKKLYFNKKVIHELWPLFLLIIVGTGSGIGEENNITQIFRDVFYLSNLVVALLFGYALFETLHFNYKKLYFVLLLASVLVSLSVLYRLSINYSVFSETLYDLRNTVGRGSILNAIGFSVPILLLKNGYQQRKSLILCSILSLLSLSVTLSRIWILTTICIIGFYYLVRKKRNVLKYFIVFLLLYSFITPIIKPLILPHLSYNTVLGRFVEKILSPYDEFTTTGYHSPGSISESWRGYESNVVLNKIKNNSIIEYLFGKGFGTMVDMGFYYEIEGELFRFKGVFHNGFLFLILKSGISGFLLYCYFFLLKIKEIYSKKLVPVPFGLQLEPLLIAGLICGLFFTAFNAGFINASAFIPVAILLGSWSIKEYQA